MTAMMMLLPPQSARRLSLKLFLDADTFHRVLNEACRSCGSARTIGFIAAVDRARISAIKEKSFDDDDDAVTAAGNRKKLSDVKV